MRNKKRSPTRQDILRDPLTQKLKVRCLIRELRARGCRLERTVGSHQTWSTPGGASLTLVVNHANADVSKVVLASVRRILRREGLLDIRRAES